MEILVLIIGIVIVVLLRNSYKNTKTSTDRREYDEYHNQKNRLY